MPERYRCAPDVAWVDGTEVGYPSAVAWVTLVPDGSAVALEGPAWLVWVALTESAQGATAAEIVERVQRMRGTDETTDGSDGVADTVVAEDVVAFLHHLAEAGLVEGE
ncbi:PqqD family peptide modification chaperone [Monashia sp. NPDC004114]